MGNYERKLSNFKNCLLVMAALLMHTEAQSQNKVTEALIPDFAGLQYAGSIGYVSIAAGYDLFKKTNFNINYGYVSENKGGKMHILALKFEYKPFKIPVGKNIDIHPINPGVFASYTFAKELSFKFNQPQYPKNYYFWSEAFRKHVGANSEIILKNPIRNGKIKAASFYLEANANDIYIISWFENRTTIPFTDIFKLGYGLRVYF